MKFKIFALLLLTTLLFPIAFADVLQITNVSLSTYVFYPGDIVDATITVKNPNCHEVQFRLEYIVGNEIFKSGDIYFIQPNSTTEITVPIEIPDKDAFKLTVRLSGFFSANTWSETYLVSQKFNYFSIIIDKSSALVEAGHNITLKLTIKNRGNENDTYKINVYGWDYYLTNNTVSVEAAKNKTVQIVYNIPKEVRVGTYPTTIEVCDLGGICRSKQFTITVTKPESEQSTVSFDDSMTLVKFNKTNKSITYIFTVTNLGDSEKNYTVLVQTDANLTSSLSDNKFSLNPDAQKTFVLTLNPLTTENHTATITISSAGSEIFSKEFTLEYVEKLSENQGITGMFVSSIQGIYLPGLIILAFIGAAFIVLTFYKQLKRKIWTEKVISYQKPTTNIYREYINGHPRSGMSYIYGPENLKK